MEMSQSFQVGAGKVDREKKHVLPKSSWAAAAQIPLFFPAEVIMPVASTDHYSANLKWLFPCR